MKDYLSEPNNNKKINKTEWNEIKEKQETKLQQQEQQNSCCMEMIYENKDHKE